MQFHKSPRAQNLIQLVKDDSDLSEEEWERAWQAATPYQRRCARLIADPTVAPHGHESTYIGWGCRCEPCTEAAAVARQERKATAVQRDFHTPEPAATAETPYAQLTLHERAVRTVEAQGYDNVTPKCRELYDEYQAQQVI